MKPIQTVTIKFPDIQLNTRDAHKLRGYIGNLFKDRSPLLHNHLENGEFSYRYPLVQYKVIEKTPMLVGLEEGAKLLMELFLKIREIKIDDREYPVLSKNIESRIWAIGVNRDLHEYRFETLWMALNQKNFVAYQNAGREQQIENLKKIAISNVLAFYKAFDLILEKEERIMMKVNVNEKNAQFKNKDMLAFKGGFVTNAVLPDYVGIGKAVSRGFGTIQKNT
jgi:hypothetical protein